MLNLIAVIKTQKNHDRKENLIPLNAHPLPLHLSHHTNVD